MAGAAANSTRAGRYISQPTGYRAFMPAPLPPDPALDLGGELTGLLSQADRALGRLDGSVLTLPNPDLFVFMYVRKEAVLSSQIEGTQSSLQKQNSSLAPFVFKMTGYARNRRFRYAPYIALFNDAAPGAEEGA